MPSVAMKGGRRALAIISPFSRPISAPAASPARTAGSDGEPRRSSRAETSPAKAITEPTDRSMPAVMMTRHSPKALMAIQEKARRMLKRLVARRKVVVTRLRNTTMAARMRNTPNSGARTRSRGDQPGRVPASGGTSSFRFIASRPPAPAGGLGRRVRPQA